MNFIRPSNQLTCMTIKFIVCMDTPNIQYYKIYLKENAVFSASRLHAFCVIRNGETLALPSADLRNGDKIWIDKSAFLANSSLRFTKKESFCVTGDTRVMLKNGAIQAIKDLDDVSKRSLLTVD